MSGAAECLARWEFLLSEPEPEPVKWWELGRVEQEPCPLRMGVDKNGDPILCGATTATADDFGDGTFGYPRCDGCGMC